jgi:hypothetical protein
MTTAPLRSLTELAVRVGAVVWLALTEVWFALMAVVYWVDTRTRGALSIAIAALAVGLAAGIFLGIITTWLGP